MEDETWNLKINAIQIGENQYQYEAILRCVTRNEEFRAKGATREQALNNLERIHNPALKAAGFTTKITKSG